MKKSKALATTSFILGLAFWIPLLNLIFGILAVSIGIRALKKIKNEPDKHGGRNLAIAGIILGIIPIILFITGLGMCLAGYNEVCESVGLTFLI